MTRTLSSLWSWILQPLLVIGILALGFVAARSLSLRREPPQRSETVAYAPLVRTVVASTDAFQVRVAGHGSLAARTRIDLVPQVGGEVVELHPELRAGGRFRAGDVLLRIEPRDYELALARAEAEVSSADTALVTRRAESESAIAEWERLRPGEAVPPLVALEPQIQEAEARLAAARAERERATLDLERTRLRLPFDGRVVEAAVDVGQVIAKNQRVGVVYATDVFEVSVPLRVDELAWLDLPEPQAGNGAGEGGATSVASVRGLGPRGAFDVPGRIVRVESELDARSRLVGLVVEVETADLEPEVAARLLPGVFVDVELAGRSLTDVVELSRGALREDGVVWVVEGGRLVHQRPEVLRHREDTVLVGGLAPGTRVVTSHLEIATEGMQVRLASGEEER